MENISPILIGIISSLVATFIFLLIRQIYIHLFLPWIRSQLYRGVKIRGRWEDTTEVSQFKFILNLKQDADRISGTLIHQERTESKVELLNYSINGYCRDGYLFALATPVLEDAVDYQTLLFRIYHKGDTLYLKGDTSFADGEHGNVDTYQNIEFKKTSV